jgi:hypothetical protein
MAANGSAYPRLKVRTMKLSALLDCFVDRQIYIRLAGGRRWIAPVFPNRPTTGHLGMVPPA